MTGFFTTSNSSHRFSIYTLFYTKLRIILSLFYLLKLQIIHNHISARHDPAPPKPPHLALMRRRHCQLRLPILSRMINIEERAWMWRLWAFHNLRPPHKQCYRRGYAIQYACVLTHHRDRRESIQANGTAEAGVVTHQVCKKKVCAAVEGCMVRV
jgi:hypothetical protein